MSEITKRLRARADEQERCNGYPADRALDREAATKIDAMRGALRGLAVVGTVRMTHGDEVIPNGGLCKLCGAEWTTRRDDGSLISPERASQSTLFAGRQEMTLLALRRRTLLATCSTMAIARAILSHARYEYRGVIFRDEVAF